MIPTHLIDAVGTRYDLEPRLVEALVLTESGGEPFAWNPEPKYRWFWNVRTKKPFRPVSPDEVRQKFPPPDFPCLAGDPDQEWWGQQASWGLTQIMGAVARELGYRAPYLPELCDASVNLEWGCRKLAQLLTWANGDYERALAAYNGGPWQNVTPPYRNQAYADKVLQTFARLSKEPVQR